MKKNEVNNIDNILKFLGDPNSKFYLWGIGETGQTFYKRFKDQIKINGFIDSSAVPGQTLFDLPVFSSAILESEKNVKIIITIQTPAYIKKVTDKLRTCGLIEHINFINVNRARIGLKYLFSKTVSLEIVELIIATRCTLNCRDCLQLMPQYKKPTFCSLDEMIQQCDETFRTIDFCEKCHIVGGEAFLHPELDQIVKYTYTHYAKQIGTLSIVTNGTIVPSENLLSTLKSCGVQVEISNYSASAEAKKKQKMQIILNMLESAGIPYVIREMDTWVDFQGDGRSHTEEDIICAMENCICCTKSFYIADNKIYTCTRYGAAEHFGLMPRQEGNSLDLSGEKLPSKKDILEWCMGISGAGYLPCCQYCTGSKLMFERVIPAAIQQERRP